MVKKRIGKKCRGLATVEMALVLPLLLLVSLGAIRYGHLFLIAQQITNAARNGARTAIRVGATNTDVTTTVDAYMSAAGIPTGQYTLTLTPGNVSAPPTGSVQAGDSVTVRITVPSANVDVLHVPLFTNFEPANWSLGATVTMAKEGF
jgi:Flp pilus assembly protein TadG